MKPDPETILIRQLVDSMTLFRMTVLACICCQVFESSFIVYRLSFIVYRLSFIVYRLSFIVYQYLQTPIPQHPTL